MANGLSKISQKLSRKQKSGQALHEKSRDAKKLRRATGRIEKLSKESQIRSRANMHFLERVAFFQEAAKVTTDVLDAEDLQRLVEGFINNKRAASTEGPPKSTPRSKSALKERADTERREWQSGFWIPDLRSRDSVEKLQQWAGDWGSLGIIAFIRLRKDGFIAASRFPPNGLS